MKQVNEKDWKLFRSRLPGWQEAYMGKLIEGYKALLNSEGQHPNAFGSWKNASSKTREIPACCFRTCGARTWKCIFFSFFDMK